MERKWQVELCESNSYLQGDYPPSSVSSGEPVIDVKRLHAKIGELTLENDFLETALTKAGLLSAKR